MQPSRPSNIWRAALLAGAGLAAMGPAASARAAALDAPALRAATDGWNTLLGRFVRADGAVDYVGLDGERAALERFLKSYEPLDFSAADDTAKKAAYINFYNAGMMSHLLRYAHDSHIAVASSAFAALRINDIKIPGGSIWSGGYPLSIGGHAVSLDDVEHRLLRGKAAGELEALKVSALDPRLHAAVNCAAVSCPRVREVAYRPATVDRMLTENLTEFVSSDAQFKKLGDAKLGANQIVYWYYDDFDDYGKQAGKGGAGGYLAEFVAPRAVDAAWKARHLRDAFNDRSKLSLTLSGAFDFSYDWRVDDVRNFR